MVAGRIRELHPASFAFVMATGILSSAELTLGTGWLSTGLLAIAVAGYLVLGLLLLLRLVRFPAETWADTARPARAFGFFTFVAATNVLAARFASSGARGAAEALAVVGAVAWLVLAYGIVARLVLAEDKPEPRSAIDGTWLIWVVGTQSVSIAVSLLGPSAGVPPRVAALVAVSLWAFGSLLYLVLIGIILARLVLAPVPPADASPPYWISMGATAITVLAGAELLRLPSDLPALVAARSSIEGVTLFEWAFGTWWFPFLVVLTIWHYRSRTARRYDQTLWSMVFPLGMYAVATEAYGRAAGLPLLPSIASVEVWLAVAAWAAVAAWMLVSWFVPTWPAFAIARRSTG